jgi:murein DD-endopeptidase MepM/ murein hydrolase activator NlpD
MKFLLSFLAFFHLISVPVSPASPAATASIPSPAPVMYHSPVTDYKNRESLKHFGEYFSAASYVGKNAIFPNHYVGYHAGTDLEILPGEADTSVPVFAIGNGKIVFSGPVSGYGQVILEKLDAVTYTALYGHVVPTVKSGQSVSAGTQIAILGQAFSSQTGGERKHLHLGIYRGSGNYFKGYEPTKTALDARWIDPLAFLASHI